jgi:hypothetical protein
MSKTYLKNQWQPQPVPHAAALGFFAVSPLDVSAKLRLLPVLKSVSYQPWPFSRKPAAETNFFNAGASQSGQ